MTIEQELENARRELADFRILADKKNRELKDNLSKVNMAYMELEYKLKKIIDLVIDGDLSSFFPKLKEILKD